MDSWENFTGLILTPAFLRTLTAHQTFLCSTEAISLFSPSHTVLAVRVSAPPDLGIFKNSSPGHSGFLSPLTGEKGQWGELNAQNQTWNPARLNSFAVVFLKWEIHMKVKSVSRLTGRYLCLHRRIWTDVSSFSNAKKAILTGVENQHLPEERSYKFRAVGLAINAEKRGVTVIPNGVV